MEVRSAASIIICVSKNGRVIQSVAVSRVASSYIEGINVGSTLSHQYTVLGTSPLYDTSET